MFISLVPERSVPYPQSARSKYSWRFLVSADGVKSEPTSHGLCPWRTSVLAADTEKKLTLMVHHFKEYARLSDIIFYN